MNLSVSGNSKFEARNSKQIQNQKPETERFFELQIKI